MLFFLNHIIHTLPTHFQFYILHIFIFILIEIRLVIYNSPLIELIPFEIVAQWRSELITFIQKCAKQIYN